MIPVRDTVSDVASGQLAAALREALARHAELQLLPADKLGAIAEYHAPNAMPTAPNAVPEVESWTRALQEAKRHFLAFGNAQALQQTQRVVAGFHAQPAARAAHGDLLAEALLTEALIHHANRQAPAATRVLQELAALAPHYAVPGRDFPPSLLAQWNQVRGSARAHGGVGSAQLSSTPPAAEVRLNGVPAGVTPLTLHDLPAGTYDVAFTAPRYGTVRKQLEVTAGRETRLNTALRWQSRGREARSSSDVAEPANAGSSAQLLAAVRLGELARAERVVIVDVDEAAQRRGVVRAQVVDTELRVGLPALTIPFDGDRHALHARLATMAGQLAKQTGTDLRAHPGRAADPVDLSDPRFLAHRGEHRRVAPAVWIAIGAAALGGIAAGVLLSRGGGEAPTTGGLVIRFE